MINRLQIILLFLTASPLLMNAQSLSGQWKGNFNERSGTDATEYVLELDIKGKIVEGISITYFKLNGKRCYTMCAVTGSYDPSSKTIISKEVSKIKANTPDWFRDCFQTHTLTYFKKGDEEQLSGTWKSAKREDNCGIGNTLLTRKTLPKRTDPTNNSVASDRDNKPAPKKGNTAISTKDSIAVKELKVVNDRPSAVVVSPDISKKLPEKFEKRTNKVFETLELKEQDIEVSIYDNAEIDGDIITVVFNGDVVLANQTLSDKPIRLKLKAKKGINNSLTMFAENQGSTPPNTAIMRIQNGEDYYKILLSADDKQNASVVFKVKE
jgi:hypothetical protein